MYVSTGAHRGQKLASALLKLQLQMVLSHQTWYWNQTAEPSLQPSFSYFLILFLLMCVWVLCLCVSAATQGAQRASRALELWCRGVSWCWAAASGSLATALPLRLPPAVFSVAAGKLKIVCDLIFPFEQYWFSNFLCSKLFYKLGSRFYPFFHGYSSNTSSTVGLEQRLSG